MGLGLITASFLFIAIFNFNRRKMQSIYHKRKTLMSLFYVAIFDIINRIDYPNRKKFVRNKRNDNNRSR